jgi:hypothetical protein
MNTRTQCHTHRVETLARIFGLALMAGLAGCVKPASHSPTSRRDDDAVVWIVKDEFGKFKPSASLDHRVEWWKDALSGTTPTSFPLSDQVEESAEKSRRLWYGPKDPLRD